MNYMYMLISAIYFLFCMLQGAYFPLQYSILGILLIIILIVRRKINFNFTAACFIAMILPIVLSTVFKSSYKIDGGLEIIKYSLFFVSYLLFISLDNRTALVKYIYAALVLLAVVGVLTYVNILPVYDGMTSPDHGYRLQSVWQNANANGLFMSIGILLSIDYFVKEKKWYYIAALLLFAFTFYVARSRTTMLITFAVLILYVLLQFRNKYTRFIFISGILAIFIVIIFFGGRLAAISLSEATLLERYYVAKDALMYLKDNLLLGMGTGEWKYNQYIIQTTKYAVKYVHCFPIQLMLDGGIFAVIFYIAGILGGISLKKEYTIYLCLILLIFLHSLLDFTLNYGVTIITMMMFLSIQYKNNGGKDL